MSRKNDGKESEKALFTELKRVMEYETNFIVGRFADTHDARNFLPPAPSDYYITYNGTPCLVEVKSSVDPVRFPWKNISGKQLGFSRRYIKAGWCSLFVIHRVDLDIWYFVPFDFIWSQVKGGESSIKWEDLLNFKEDLEYKFWSYL